MWVFARALHIAMGTLPLELLLGWKFVFVIEAVPEVFESTVPFHEPLEGLEIGDSFANLHSHVEMRADDHEFEKDGSLVILVEISEVFLES